MTTPAVTSIVDGYRAGSPDRHDEMLTDAGAVHPAWSELAQALDHLGPDGLTSSATHTARLLDSDGAVYRSHGSEHPQRWPLDPLPVMLTDDEWTLLEEGLRQRAELLDAVLTDLYGKRSLLRNALIPAELIHAHGGFLRNCDGIEVPGPHQMFTASADLARHSDGSWRVLDDRISTPSGAAYAMENRRVISRVLPGLYREARIQRLGPFFHTVRLGLQEVAPLTAEAPSIVLLTSGPSSETAYDQAFLSQLLGYPLVSGSDLFFSEDRMWMRGLDGAQQVDVILRRVDADFCDPLELRPESQLGVPGLVEACRLGTVSVVNPLGSGVLENPGLMAYLPALCKALRDEDLLIESAPSYWCGDERSRRYVREHLDDLVVKPTSRGLPRRSRFGRDLSADERETLLARIEAEPHAWAAQELVEPSTTPTLDPTGSGTLSPRAMVLRTFAAAQGGAYHAMVGGLVRVAAHAGESMVAGRAGAVSKDACVLATSPKPVTAPWLLDGAPSQMRVGALSPRMAQDLFWMGRYTERAEFCTRLLRTVGDLGNDVAFSRQPALIACFEEMLQVITQVTMTWPGFMGAQGTPGAELRADPADELHALIVDSDRPGTLAHSTQRLNEAAQAVRDQLSPDTWVVLGALDRALRELARDPDGLGSGLVDVSDPGHALSVALSSLLAVAGLSAESMTRDLGWHFMQAGRRVERALQETSLLRASLVSRGTQDSDGMVMESVLAASESIITYRRRYGTRVGVATMLDLLVLDRHNPRAIAHQVQHLVESLTHLPDSPEVGEALEQIAHQMRDCDLRSMAAVEVNGWRTELYAFLDDLHTRFEGLATSIESAYFADLMPPLPLVGTFA